MKEYIFKDLYMKQINPRRPNKSSIRVQIRCLRLDGIGYEHSFPKFGFLQVNDSKN